MNQYEEGLKIVTIYIPDENQLSRAKSLETNYT
jgi:hypothetical protein